MSGSDDEELAALRRSRAQKLGSSGLTVTAQRRQYQAPAAQTRGGYNDNDEDNDNDDGPVIVHTDPGASGRHTIDDADYEEDEIPAELRAQFPASFGGDKVAKHEAHLKSLRDMQQAAAQGVKRDTTGDDDDQEHLASGPAPGIAEEENEEDSDYDIGPSLPSTTLSDPWDLPISSEISLKGHTHAVTAFDIDHSGNRIISGSTDYTVKLYDFNGMKSDFKCFRSIEPAEGHPINALSWSPNGEAFLVVTGSPQPKIYDRDGKEQGEMVRGDMYIRDMKNTKGHVSGCTGGQWHPTDRGTGMTCSDDGTVRIWDFWTLEQKTVIKPTLAKPGRVAVTACRYNNDGRLVSAGLMDGTIQVWDVRGKFGQSAALGLVGVPKAQMVGKQNWSFVSGSNQIVRNAHTPKNEITWLEFSRDGKSMLSRGADDTLKLWDLRQFKRPIAVAEGLPTTYGNTQCCFSPDERLVLTGTSATSASINGGLVFLDKSDLSVVRRLGMPGSVVTVQWHPKINQIFTGCGDRKVGETRVLFDPAKSLRGALLCVSRKTRVADASDYVAAAEPEIFNPNALPMYRQQWPGGGKGKRKQEVDASIRTTKSFKPDLGTAGPAAGKGAGGKLGSTGGTLLTQYVLKNQGQLKNPKEEDIRASILRHADKQDEFSRFTEAYAATQPTKIYAEEEKEDDEDAEGGGQK